MAIQDIVVIASGMKPLISPRDQIVRNLCARGKLPVNYDELDYVAPK
jgi:hypothetical protein